MRRLADRLRPWVRGQRRVDQGGDADRSARGAGVLFPLLPQLLVDVVLLSELPQSRCEVRPELDLVDFVAVNDLDAFRLRCRPPRVRERPVARRRG